MAARLVSEHSQQVQRVRMVRCFLEDLAVKGLGLVRPARLVVLDCEAEALGNREHGAPSDQGRAGGRTSSRVSPMTGSPLRSDVARMTTGMLYGPSAPAAKRSASAAFVCPTATSTGSA